MRLVARTRGFTVIELMMVMAMVGIMVAIAAPNMRDLIVRMRVKTAASDLHSSLIMARSEAIKRNAGMQVVPTDATNWALGWTVRVQASGTVLDSTDAYPNISVATANASYTPTAVAAVTFSGTGRETGSAGSGVAFVVTSSAYPNITARCVVLSPSGRPAVRQDRDNNSANGCN
jgi:type IV fimbrial biogenesis protein FimT